MNAIGEASFVLGDRRHRRIVDQRFLRAHRSGMGNDHASASRNFPPAPAPPRTDFPPSPLRTSSIMKHYGRLAQLYDSTAFFAAAKEKLNYI
ncbi:MAG: hypothetical protein LBS49_14175 [Candidatus Accumulibacter sp.]|nr:hypothetical protein [Accumulibacter sp.]